MSPQRVTLRERCITRLISKPSQKSLSKNIIVNILVTNDDGIDSEGLKALSVVLGELGKVFIVAPDRQRSAVGSSITIDRPVRVNRGGERTVSVDGMPADCVTLGIHKLVDPAPDLIMSGINDGQNLGYDV